MVLKPVHYRSQQPCGPGLVPESHHPGQRRLGRAGAGTERLQAGDESVRITAPIGMVGPDEIPPTPAVIPCLRLVHGVMTVDDSGPLAIVD